MGREAALGCVMVKVQSKAEGLVLFAFPPVQSYSLAHPRTESERAMRLCGEWLVAVGGVVEERRAKERRMLPVMRMSIQSGLPI